MPFRFTPGPIEGLMIIEPTAFPDERGVFLETYKESEFRKAGLTDRYVQDNHSVSISGVLRGLHYQLPPYAQAKLIRVVKGRVWDVAVDLRKTSKTFRKWHGIELSEDNRKMFYIPAGFAHGFMTLADGTEFLYKCTAEYNKERDRGIRWDDPEIGIEWPGEKPLVSPKDQALPFCRDAEIFEFS